MALNDNHEYSPTIWKDDSEPDINADNLNKIENALKQNGITLNELAAAVTDRISKSQIVNNLLATVPGNVLDATQGKNLQDEITRLNGEMDNLLLYFGYGEYSESPLASFKRAYSRLPTGRVSMGYVANASYASGFMCFKYTEIFGSVILFSYSNAFPNIMYARLTSDGWIENS